MTSAPPHGDSPKSRGVDHLKRFAEGSVELNTDSENLLKAEYDYLSSAFLANEEAGEKRVNVFLTVVAAATAALGLVFDDLSWRDRATSVTVVAAVLLGFGLMTLLRLMVRNVATTRYLDGLRRIRGWWVCNDPDLVHYLAFPPTGNLIERKRSARKRSEKSEGSERDEAKNGADGPWYGNGGWLELVAAINALLAATTVASSAWLAAMHLTSGTISLTVGVGVAVGSAFLAWKAQMQWTDSVYDRRSQKIRDDRADAETYWGG